MNADIDASASGTTVEQFDVEAVNAAGRRKLYAARTPIYPKRVHGTFRKLKWFVLFATLGVYYLLPWVRWTRGPNEPDQAILVDFAGSRFYFFGIELWPDELYYITGLLVLAALLLFLATALFGRVWCGYTCPQTVWTDLFIAVERFIEGDRNKRIKLAKAPWTADKLRKKFIKHALWIVIGMATGGAWILYFHDAPTIARDFLRGEAPFTAYFFFGLLTLTTYVFAGSMREQVCTYMCPWPRIQAALTDEHTLQVTYRRDRGEPRGAHKKNQDWAGRGDCVDCKACVAACPMGIDIREGAQLECINCALCIDACDDIMAKVERPLGLIAYDTDANVMRREQGGSTQFSFIRARTILYTLLLAAVGGLMLFQLTTRATVNLAIERDRTPPYVTLSDGSVRNAYTVKIVNRDNVQRDFRLQVDGPDAMTISAVGEQLNASNQIVSAAGDKARALRVFITLPPKALSAPSLPISITVTDVMSGETTTTDTIFLSGD